MNELNSIAIMYGITPCHAGSGSSMGIVDLPIQRERHTNWPVIQSSGVKGALLLFCVNLNLTWKGYFLILFHERLRSAYILNRLSVVTVGRYPGPNQVRRLGPFFSSGGET